ncbi:MAG TPA: PaaX family transcriptional regulator C-terminal domain-containing protein [Acidimicrobiales bacterium]|nr:PaaX family transcriptional regulator C-terminal domain-containing protein [Acidimicrobiales bacterium]
MIQGRNAPLTARSVLASTLLGVDPPELPVAYLVHVAGLFGINDNRARVALSRMVGSGETTTDGAGRYRLAGRLLDRQARQLASRAGHSGGWSGDWRVVVVTTAGSSAEIRSKRRSALRFARLGELREGTWMRPDNIKIQLDPEVELDSTLLLARPDGDQPALAARLWDLEGWGQRARQLMESMEARPTRKPADLAPGFELSASVLRHLQADPLLPDELLPAGWPGGALREQYDGWDAGYRSVLDKWSRTT